MGEAPSGPAGHGRFLAVGLVLCALLVVGFVALNATEDTSYESEIDRRIEAAMPADPGPGAAAAPQRPSPGRLRITLELIDPQTGTERRFRLTHGDATWETIVPASDADSAAWRTWQDGFEKIAAEIAGSVREAAGGDPDPTVEFLTPRDIGAVPPMVKARILLLLSGAGLMKMSLSSAPFGPPAPR